MEYKRFFLFSDKVAKYFSSSLEGQRSQRVACYICFFKVIKGKCLRVSFFVLKRKSKWLL